MAKVIFTLQSKGGVGKSYTSTILTQYFLSVGNNTTAFDTDTLNATLKAYKALPVTHLNLLENNNEIDPRVFDSMMEKILSASDDETFIIDSGSTTFHSMASYLIENDVFDLLLSHGHEPIINSIVAGGADTAETLKCIKLLLESTDVKMLIWLNPFQGKLEHNGKEIESLKLFKDYSKRIIKIIHLGEYSQATTGRDIEDMLEKRITFDEAISSLSIMPSSRINKVKTYLWNQLETSFNA